MPRVKSSKDLLFNSILSLNFKVSYYIQLLTKACPNCLTCPTEAYTVPKKWKVSYTTHRTPEWTVKGGR